MAKPCARDATPTAGVSRWCAVRGTNHCPGCTAWAPSPVACRRSRATGATGIMNVPLRIEVAADRVIRERSERTPVVVAHHHPESPRVSAGMEIPRAGTSRPRWLRIKSSRHRAEAVSSGCAGTLPGATACAIRATARGPRSWYATPARRRPPSPGRGAAEQQVSNSLLAVRKDAEQWKEIRFALHFVDHDGAGQTLQGSLRFVQSDQAPRILKVEEMLSLE